MTFPQQIAQSNAPDNRLRIGTVSQVNPLRVSIQGEDVINPGVIDRSLGFTAGDIVALLRQDQTWLVFGRVWSNSFPQMQAGTATINLVAATSFVLHVDFARRFIAIPSVSINLNTGVGPSAGWGGRAINVSQTGFDIFIFGASATFTAVVQWQAQEMTQ